MNSEKAMENRKTDKKAFGKFAVILILCTLGGGIGGFFSAFAKGTMEGAADWLMWVLGLAAPWGNIVITTVMLIWVSIVVSRARRMFTAWDGEDESVADQIGLKLTYCLTAASINMIICYFFLGAGVYALDFEDPYQISTAIKLAAVFIGIFYALLVNTLLQKNIVNFCKELNPEKQGSVYDMKFQKTWLESCDEAERMQTYMACYKAYRAASAACIGLWLFCVIGMMSWDFGMLPMTMVLLIWLVMVVSYSIEAIRISKHPGKLMR